MRQLIPARCDLQGTPMRQRRWWCTALLLISSVVAMPSAHAQERKRITLDDFVIEGNIQKPEAFFILPRTTLNFQDLERRENLKQRIIDSIKKDPF